MHAYGCRVSMIRYKGVLQTSVRISLQPSVAQSAHEKPRSPIHSATRNYAHANDANDVEMHRTRLPVVLLLLLMAAGGARTEVSIGARTQCTLAPQSGDA